MSDTDTVLELGDIPQSLPGSPTPTVLATDLDLVLIYLLNEPGPNWSNPSASNAIEPGESICVVRFAHARAHYFGSPNDEALSGHPLHARGLGWYGSYEIRGSSWIRALEQMNSVHPMHDASRFRQLRHFVLTFHDSMFECVAESFSIEVRRSLMRDVVLEVASSIR